MRYPAEPTGGEAVGELLERAAAARPDAPALVGRLLEARRRLDEPLRLAVVGRVKAGKSTVVNALLGEEVAGTGAAECTREVTWYRFGRSAAVTRHGADGRRPLPVRRGRNGLDVTAPVEDGGRLVVDWPAERLTELTLVDTPGTASSPGAAARTAGLVTPADGAPPDVDALLLLTRRVDAEDVALLRRFQAAAPGPGAQGSTLTVLSRADEVGAGRLEALPAAGRVARRAAAAPEVAELVGGVLPVAGLLALTGRTLRHDELVSLRSLATLPAAELEWLLRSADRFARPGATGVLPAEARAALLARLGAFGVRLATSLVREGTDDAASLGAQLVRRSGLAELERLIAVQFTARAGRLRARSAAAVLEDALRRAPRPGDDGLRAGLERHRAAAADLAELDLIARLRGAGAPLPADQRPAAARLLGAEGTTAAARLGIPAESDQEQARTTALAALGDWQVRAAEPLAPRVRTDAAEVVLHSLERVLSAAGRSGTALPEPPRDRPGGQQEGAGEAEQPGGADGVPVDLRAAGHHAADHQRHRHRRSRDRRQPPAGPGAAVQQQDDADGAEQRQHPDRGERGDQGGRDAVPHEVRRGLRVLRHRPGSQPRP
ncbi:dynamin family protein [uncultured Modestobacter sp.]|uniref:dynamin family protein n=1 Tax=uncultured Modestobacter sp. TaxID=380048 RepID=UPI0026141FAF|nr:dynamin family protein [uncultured Modestobacter sp.]